MNRSEVDPEWVKQVAEAYRIPLDSTKIQVYWAPLMGKGIGGRCIYGFPTTIELSGRRVALIGRKGMEKVLAHELLHAYLGNSVGHGPLFRQHAITRGISRHCAALGDLQRAYADQLQLGEPEKTVERRAAIQAMFNERGDVGTTTSKLQEWGPRPLQASLLGWGDDQDKLAKWKNAGAERTEGGDPSGTKLDKLLRRIEGRRIQMTDPKQSYEG